MESILERNIRVSRNVSSYIFGPRSVEALDSLLVDIGDRDGDYIVYCIDHFFEKEKELVGRLPISEADEISFINSTHEPDTELVNRLTRDLKSLGKGEPRAIIGVGGGCTMDVAKAVSNLWTNGGDAEEYQGWDLVKVPGIFKIGVPTISGTGAEVTRTCVMTNPKNGLKLGMNSDHSVFDRLVLDPDLSRSVLRDQYFFTGMDAYIHCVESLKGTFRHAIGDSLAEGALKLCRDVFFSSECQGDANREKLMVASYLGGLAVAESYVGVVHPFSAGLSVVLGIHHCLANCIAMTGMEEFYPKEVDEFRRMAQLQKIDIPAGICQNLTQDQFDRLYQATIVHEKPLTNALGNNFQNILTRERVEEIFGRM